MSEKQREQETTPAAAAPAAAASMEEKKVMVSPVQVLLGAVDLATTRGAFRIAELQLITQAYAMLTQKPAEEQGQGQGQSQAQEQKESKQQCYMSHATIRSIYIKIFLLFFILHIHAFNTVHGYRQKLGS